MVLARRETREPNLERKPRFFSIYFNESSAKADLSSFRLRKRRLATGMQPEGRKLCRQWFLIPLEAG